MTTANDVKKALDKAYDKLTPEERAHVVSASGWKIADTYARREDITAQVQEQHRFIDKYVDNLTNSQFIHFLIALADRYEVEWGRRYCSMYIQGLVREDALIGMLLINLDCRWFNEIELAPKKEYGTPWWTKKRDKIAKQITIVRERKRVIAADIDEILEGDIWEIRQMQRPPQPDIDPEMWPTIYEEAIEKIETRKAKPTNQDADGLGHK